MNYPQSIPHDEWAKAVRGVTFVPTRPSKPEPPIGELIRAAREGFALAKQYGFRGVNSCPYGPAYPGNENHLAHAWYKGFWFCEYIVKGWRNAAHI